MASTNKTINSDIPEKDVFTLHFLQSLSNLTTQTPFNTSNQKTNRVKKIKQAAYVSMAKAAGGTKRLWSKALLRKASQENKIVRFSKKKVTWQISSRRRRRRRRRSNRRAPVVEEAAERLRSYVPGGGGMETSKLMEETAHYIKCLSMQVNVMQCLVDGLSSK